MRAATRSVTFVAFAMLILPSVGTAQGRGTRGEPDVDWNAVAKNGSSGPTISAKDVDGINAFKVLVDKRKDLKLTDDQVVKFKTFETTLREKNAPLGKAVDSLRKAMKTGSGTPTAEDEARMVIARESLMTVLREARSNNDASLKDAMPLLDESQQKVAGELLRKENEEYQQMIRSKLGGRAGGGGGRRGGS
jgi:hypothetical protein